MPSKEAELLRKQVLRSQRIATLKKNIEVLSSDIQKGNHGQEQHLPASAQATVVQQSKITDLQAELRELELKQKIQKALMERSKPRENKESHHEEKPSDGKVPFAETHLNAGGAPGHTDERVTKKSRLDCVKIKRNLGAYCDEASPQGESEKSLHAHQAPTPKSPVPVRKDVPNANDTAARKKILERLQRVPSKASAIAAQTGQNTDLAATQHEHESNEQAEIAVERTKAEEQGKTHNKEKKSSGKVPTSETPLEAENAMSHGKGTAPEKRIFNPLKQAPDSAQAIAAQTSKSVNPLSAIHEHEPKRQIAETIADGIKVAEKLKDNCQEKKTAEEKPHGRPHPDSGSEGATAAQADRNAALLAKIRELELKLQIKKAAEQRIKAVEKNKSNNHEKETAGKVITTKDPLEAGNTMSQANDTAPKKIILKLRKPTRDSAQAIAIQTSKSVDPTAAMLEHDLKGRIKKPTLKRTNTAEMKGDLQAKIHELEQSQGFEKTTERRLDTTENEKISDQKTFPSRKVPHNETSLEAQMPVWSTHKIALNRKKVQQPPAVTAQALAAYESGIGEIKAQLQKYELKRHTEKTAAEGTKSVEKMGKDLRQTPAGTVLEPKTPVQIPRPVLQTHHTAPKKKNPDHQPHTPRAQAIAAYEGKIRNFGARLEKHQLEMKKQRADQRAKGLASKINSDCEGQIPVGNGSTEEAQREVGKAVPHADETSSKKRKPEEGPEVIPDNAKKQRYTPEPQVHEENPPKRKHNKTEEPDTQSPESISASEQDEKTVEDTKLTPTGDSSTAETPMEVNQIVPHADKASSKKRKAEENPEAVPDSVKKQRYSPELKAQQETPLKRELIETVNPKIESPEYISIVEYDEQDGSTAETPLEVDEAVPHADETDLRERKAEEDPAAVPDRVNKQSYSSEPNPQPGTWLKRKLIETAELDSESSEYISVVEYDEQDVEDTKLTPTGDSSTAETPMEVNQAVPHAEKTSGKKRKAEENLEAGPDSLKKQRCSPKPKAQPETPRKRRLIETAKPDIETPEHISITEYDEQDVEVGGAELGNTVDGSVPEVPLRPVEADPHRGAQAVVSRTYMPFSYVPDIWEDEVDYGTD